MSPLEPFLDGLCACLQISMAKIGPQRRVAHTLSRLLFCFHVELFAELHDRGTREFDLVSVLGALLCERVHDGIAQLGRGGLLEALTDLFWHRSGHARREAHRLLPDVPLLRSDRRLIQSHVRFLIVRLGRLFRRRGLKTWEFLPCLPGSLGRFLRQWRRSLCSGTLHLLLGGQRHTPTRTNRLSTTGDGSKIRR